MNIINPSFEIITKINGDEIIKKIERAARVCYKSEGHIGNIEKARSFVGAVIASGHESVIEHEAVTVKVVCDRGVSHEIVRHRLASYSQESTRYCNYEKKGLTFIKPCFWRDDSKEYDKWFIMMRTIENVYNSMIVEGSRPEEARSILPNSLKTELIMTMNLREWRHFFKLRTSKLSHPQMREIACPMLDKFKELIPVIFDDINYEGI